MNAEQLIEARIGEERLSTSQRIDLEDALYRLDTTSLRAMADILDETPEYAAVKYFNDMVLTGHVSSSEFKLLKSASEVADKRIARRLLDYEFARTNDEVDTEDLEQIASIYRATRKVMGL